MRITIFGAAQNLKELVEGRSVLDPLIGSGVGAARQVGWRAGLARSSSAINRGLIELIRMCMKPIETGK